MGRGKNRFGLSVAVFLTLVGAAWGQGGPPPPPPGPPLPPVPVPQGNPITENKRVLGKILFWDEQLSSTNTMSCGTCHTPSRGGAENRPATHTGLDNILGTPDDVRGSAGVVRSDTEFDFLRDSRFGLQPQVTGRASPVAIDAAFAPNLFWDGRATGTFRDPVTNAVVLNAGAALESQAAGPPTSNAEMGHDGVNWIEVVGKLGRAKPLDYASNIPPDVSSALAGGVSYRELFQRAFGDPEITAARAIMAIATYERTLIADQTPFDAFNAGNPNALTAAQQRGLGAMGGSNCRVCHAGPLFTDQSFRNVGLRPIAEDTGRQVVTGNNADRGKFKVPSLRNVGLKRTFMHNGQFTTLTDLILFYARAPGAAQQFPDNRDPIMLAVNVPPGGPRADMEDFLRNGLTDPRVANQTFPFDHPTLTSERADLRTTILGGGVAGSGGAVAKLIADMPAKLGWEKFRVGIDGPVGSAARLVMSLSAPVGGIIAEERTLGTVTIDSTGLATLHTILSPDKFSPGQPIYLQWVIDDPAAPGGIARSEVGRVPLFCGLGGCPIVCAADVAGFGGAPGPDGQLTPDDIVVYLTAFFSGDIAVADKASLGGILTADGAITVDDLVVFLSVYFSGCQ